MISTRRLRTLDLAAGGHLSAASGLVIAGHYLHVVADDDLALGVFDLHGGAGRTLPLLAGDLPEEKAARKARKADFEILFEVPGHGLLAMGSGSRPTRERAVSVHCSPQGDALSAHGEIDIAPLCARLREHFPALNLEGAALLGDDCLLLQRASGEDARNALLRVPRESLLRALAHGAWDSPAVDVVEVALGDVDGLPWSFTDAVACGDGLLATAVLEDTRSAYDDGACHGSALVRLRRDGTLEWLRRLDTPAKVEGIALHEGEAWLVTDADDRAVPAELLAARWE